MKVLVYDDIICVKSTINVFHRWGKKMAEDNKSSVHDMYDGFVNEAADLQKKININLMSIAEIDEYINSIYEKEGEDFKVFSPRSVDNLYKDDLDAHREKKNILEIDNRCMYKRLNVLNSYIDTLKDVLYEKAPTKNLSVLDIQEKERQRIARDLHDTSLQNLAHLVHKIELASMYIDKDVFEAKMELATIHKSLKAVIEEIRNTIFDLRPMHFDDLGLKESFERLFVKLKDANTAIDFETNIGEIHSDNELILMTIFRVVQEASSNAVKHSGGNKISVVIEQINKNCNIMIKDNGKGFTSEDLEAKANKHFGIPVMKERVNLLGGSMTIESESGNGTTIKMSIPVE